VSDHRRDHQIVRRRIRCGLGALALALVFAAGCGHAGAGTPLSVGAEARLARGASSHVLVMVMENAEADDILAHPPARYIASLLRSAGLATESYAITHPSLPNYLALTSGSTHGVSSDCVSCHFDARNIVDQLEAKGISWKAYLEDVPGACFRGSGAAGYAKKHNPFIYYDDIARSQPRCRRLVGFPQLAADLRNGRLPTYAWISPNLCDDGHDCGVAGADRFLSHTVPVLLRGLGPHGFLVITWDEGRTSRGCCAGVARGGHIVTILAGPDVRRGSRSRQPVDHYGTLATIEEALGLPLLAGAGDPRSGRLTGLFAKPPRLP